MAFNWQPVPVLAGVGGAITLTLGALFVIVLIVGGLEWAGRAFLRKRLGSDLRAPQALRDRFTAWRNNPEFHRSDIEHNAQGFRRSGGVSVRKAPGSYRVFLLGGSAAYGAQGGFTHIDNRWTRMRNEQLIDSFLEHYLNRAPSQSRAEVINAAVSGYRIHQQLALIQSRVCRYQPDEVVLLDGYNDFIGLYNWARGGCRSKFDVYENTPGREEFDALANPKGMPSLAAFGKAWLCAHSSLFSIALRHVPGQVSNPWKAAAPRELREITRVVRAGDLTGEERLAAAAALENVSYFSTMARQIHRILDLNGIRPLFLLQPILILSDKRFTEMERNFLAYEWQIGGPLYFYLFREIYHEIDRSMSEAAEAEGFRYINLVNVFDGTAEQTFSDFAHLTPAGNKIVAEQLFEVLFPHARGV